MTDKFYNDKARQCKAVMQTRRKEPKGTLKDIVVLIKAMEGGDYSSVYQTKLYKNNGGEYCEYIEIISSTLFGR